MKDGKQVLGKFFFWAVYWVVENQEFATVLFAQPPEDFNAKSRKTVSVGNHKRELVAAQKSSQYGPQSFSFEVKTAADVRDDFRLWEPLAHVDDLSGKIVALFG